MNRLTGLAAALLLAACTPLAQGAIAISYSLNGGADVVCGAPPLNPNPVSSGPAVCAFVSEPGLSIQEISASSNSPGTPALSQQQGATLLITTTAAIPSLKIFIGAQDFVTPTTPPAINYLSNLSFTDTTGTGTAALTSCVAGDNGLGETPFCGSPEASLTNATLTLGPGAGANSISETISSLTVTPYSLEQEITLLNLSSGANINVITSQILTPVPEPASILFFSSTLLGAGLLFRRKLQSKRG